MALKFILDSIEGLAPDVAKEYTLKDGKYVLDVNDIPESAKVKEFRENNIKLLKDLEKFKGVDPVKYQQTLQKLQKIEEGELLEAGKVEQVIENRVTAMRTDYEGKVSDLTGKLESTTKHLESLLIDSAVRTESALQKALGMATEDIVLRARQQMRVKDGVTTIVDAKGEVVFGKDGKTPLTISEWVVGLKKTAPHLFEGSVGADGLGARFQRGGQDVNKMSSISKISEGLAQR